MSETVTNKLKKLKAVNHNYYKKVGRSDPGFFGGFNHYEDN